MTFGLITLKTKLNLAMLQSLSVKKNKPHTGERFKLEIKVTN